MADGHAKFYKQHQGPLDSAVYADSGNGCTFWNFRKQ